MVRRANQRPTWSNLPDIEATDGGMASLLASTYFGEPLEWQGFVLDRLLARDEADKYLFHSIGFSIPRQNGKSWDVLARCLYGLVASGERILYTCQHGDTADEMFKRLSEIFEDEDNEELHDLLFTVRKTNGQQAIILNNGGYIRFTTRTNSLARGKSYDVLIYDEAQELTSSQQAASLFAISASRLHNTQTIYLGTPPDPSCVGDVFQRLHDEAHAGKEGAIAWFEWAVTEIGDIYDRDRWYETNPSLGILIDETAVEGELSTSDDTFARERLGWWSPVFKAMAAIPKGDWEATQIKGIGNAYDNKKAFGLKFSPDGSHYALVGVKTDKKGRSAFELVEVGATDNGTKALAEELWKRRSDTCVVVVDGLSGASAFCDNISELNPPRGYIVRPTAGDVVAATTGLVDSLADGSVKHTKQSQMDESATHATRRAIGKRGGWGFECEPPYDATPIDAAALAVWGVRNTKRNPRRKQRLL